MPHSEELLNLLERYEEMRAQETAPSPEEMCKDFPHLLDAFRQLLRKKGSLYATRDVSTVAPVSSTPDWENERKLSQTGSSLIPGYEILEELGRGGMGVVYKARQLALERLVALKIILAGSYAGEQERTRFRIEAEAVARLQHPNIVQIFEVAEHNGMPFFSLEFCGGGTLSGQLTGKTWASERAAKLIERLARGIQSAHESQIIHRDLKPANVLFTSEGEPKISDFGLAKKLDETVGQTQTGAIMGTPSYMAPEQAAGNTKDIGPAADIYALGVMLYELLTGRPPFRGQSPFDIIPQVISQEPLPPSQLNSKIPADLQNICLKCLQKAPRDRYESAWALATDLKRFLAGEPVEARRAPLWNRTWRKIKKIPAIGIMIGGLLFVAAAIWYVVAFSPRDFVKGKFPNQFGEPGPKAKIVKAREYDCHWAGFSPDAKTIAVRFEESRGTQGAIHFMDLQSKKTIARTPDYPKQELGRVYYYSRDGRTLAGTSDRDIVLWDIATGLEKKRLKGHFERISCSALSPSGWLLGTGSADRTIRLWDLKNATEQAVLSDDSPVSIVAFSANGERLGSTAGGSVATIWNVNTGRKLVTLKGHTKKVLSIAFSRDGKLIATGSLDRTLRLWESATGKQTRLVTSDVVRNAISGVFFSFDNKMILATDSGALGAWNIATGEERWSFKAGELRRVAFSPNMEQLAIVQRLGNEFWLGLVEASSGRIQRKGPEHQCINHVTYSLDGKKLAISFSGGSRLLDFSQEREMIEMDVPHPETVSNK